MYSQRRVYSTVTHGRVLVDNDIIRREGGLGLVYVIFATYRGGGGGGDSLASHCMSSIVVRGRTAIYLGIYRAVGIFACTPLTANVFAAMFNRPRLILLNITRYKRGEFRVFTAVS